MATTTTIISGATVSRDGAIAEYGSDLLQAGTQLAYLEATVTCAERGVDLGNLVWNVTSATATGWAAVAPQHGELRLRVPSNGPSPFILKSDVFTAAGGHYVHTAVEPTGDGGADFTLTVKLVEL